MTGDPAAPLLVATTVVLAGIAVALAMRPRCAFPGATVEASRSAPARARPALLRRLRPALSACAAGGVWVLVGGLPGWVAGVVGATAVWVVLGRVEDPAAVRRRERLAADLPVGVDLLASCLDAGAAPGPALVTVSRALGGPVGEEFLAIHHRLRIGVDPAEVWRTVAAHEQLAPLGRSVGRAHETGAAVGLAVHRLAAELRARSRAEVEARARTVEVRAAAPLGLCLLPAFVVLGVVPMVAAVFGAMRLF